MTHAAGVRHWCTTGSSSTATLPVSFGVKGGKSNDTGIPAQTHCTGFSAMRRTGANGCIVFALAKWCLIPGQHKRISFNLYTCGHAKRSVDAEVGGPRVPQIICLSPHETHVTYFLVTKITHELVTTESVT